MTTKTDIIFVIKSSKYFSGTGKNLQENELLQRQQGLLKRLSDWNYLIRACQIDPEISYVLINMVQKIEVR